MAERSRSRERRRDGSGLVVDTSAGGQDDFLADLFGNGGGSGGFTPSGGDDS